MECELENQAEQDADRVRLIPDPGKPIRREREAHEVTYVPCRSWCIACVRGRGVALTHFRNTTADEERLHTFEMYYCFPSQDSQQGITVLAVKEMQGKAGSAFMVPSEERIWYLVKVVTDFMSAHGCGRSISKSDREPSHVLTTGPEKCQTERHNS